MIEKEPLALSVRDVSKTYKGRKDARPALTEVSFSIEQGDFFGLLGPNGAGKSTLIGILAKTVKPDTGDVSVLGFDLDKNWQNFKMSVGIVPQEITFDPFLTVWETLSLQSGYFGLRNNDAWLNEMLDILELSGKKKDPVSRLSGGMKRRVLIAQALVHKPPLIVLDEPTAGVDINLRHALWNFMEELNRRGHTIILTTHYLEEAERLCKNVAMLNHGKVAALSDTSSLLKKYSDDRCIFALSTELPENFPLPVAKLPNGFYSMTCSNSDQLRNLLNELDKRGQHPEDLELGKANLEEVFMRITAE